MGFNSGFKGLMSEAGIFHDTAALTPGKEPPVPLGTGGWVGATCGPDVSWKTRSLARVRSRSTIPPVVQHVT